mgnify:CR=1 FL=1
MLDAFSRAVITADTKTAPIGATAVLKIKPKGILKASAIIL